MNAILDITLKMWYRKIEIYTHHSMNMYDRTILIMLNFSIVTISEEDCQEKGDFEIWSDRFHGF